VINRFLFCITEFDARGKKYIVYVRKIEKLYNFTFVSCVL